MNVAGVIGGRRRIERWIRILIIVNILVVAGLVALVAFDLLRGGGQPAPLSGQGGQPSPSPSFALMQMGVAHIPTSNACALCHGSGGQVKAIPAVLHPIEGWRRCLVCHTDENLGRKAPGHVGIAEEECLNCHKVAQAGPAITQPHAKLQDQHCLTCHGGVAHLPSSMASSREADCVLCHKPTDLPPPAYPHVVNARLGCRQCHQSAEVGALPIDHALRTDGTCLLCHELRFQPAAETLLPVPSSGSTPEPNPT